MSDDRTTVLAFPGEVDHRATGPLYERAAQLLGPGVRRLVIDLTETTFLDSTGIGLLVRIKSLADVDSAAVVLRNPGRRVLRTLEVAGMSGYLPTETG